MSYFLTRRFNQDNLENFFSGIRSHGVRNISPDVTHFISSFKALVVNNFMSSGSPGANCEEDFSSGALDNLTSFITGEEIPGVEPLEDDEVAPVADIPEAVLKCKRSRVGRNTVAYVAGYVGKKVLKKTKGCDRCKKILTTGSETVESEVIAAKEYDNCELMVPGGCLNFIVKEATTRIFYILPRHCTDNNISQLLVNTVLHHCPCQILNCPQHPELGKMVIKLIVKCLIHFWCSRINLLLKGKERKCADLTLSNFATPDLFDPIMLAAHNKYLKKCKNKRQ